MPSPSLGNITGAIYDTIEELNGLTTLGPDAELERAKLVLFLEGISKIVEALAECDDGTSYIPRWASGSGQSS
jgi:hypothetical protein